MPLFHHACTLAAGACLVAAAGCPATLVLPPDGGAADLALDVAPADAAPVDAASPPDLAGPCPPSMVLVTHGGGRVCVDRYEARVVQVTGAGAQPWPPTQAVDQVQVRAVVDPGTQPQAYISGAQAQDACMLAGKRLCALDEWLAACRGPANTTYPYGDTYRAGACNEGRTPHPVVQYFGTNVGVWDYAHLNNPGIDEQANTVAVGGGYPACVSAWGIYDLVGNLHEWVLDGARPPPKGTFKGGYYVDATINGPGCRYTTIAHGFTYHDYSTGFRCCADPR